MTLETGLRALLIAAAIGLVSGWVTAARYRGIAEGHASHVERLQGDLAAQADSTSAARARAHAVERRAEAQRAAHDQTVARLNARLTDLSASHASLEAAAEAEMQSHAGWLSRERHEAVVANLERTLLLTDSLRVEAEALARTERERGDALEVHVGSLVAQIDVMETISETQALEIKALRRSSGGFLPDFGDFTKPVYVALGAGVGYLIAEVR